MFSEKRRSVVLKGLLLLMGLSVVCLAEIHARTAPVSEAGASGAAGGLFIPAGLAPATNGPTKSDGILYAQHQPGDLPEDFDGLPGDRGPDQSGERGEAATGC